MNRNISYRIVSACLVGVLMLMLAPWLIAYAQTDERCFVETGQCISGRIREFWEQNGAETIFGLPISPQQPAEIHGRTAEVQWFERARLELHPGNTYPDDVQMTNLGSMYINQGSRPPRDQPEHHRLDCVYFETGYNVCGEVLAQWRTYGIEMDGLPGNSEIESRALFGAPLSGGYSMQFADGNDYVVQWFERARFEVRSDGVALSVIGTELYEGVTGIPSPSVLPPPPPELFFYPPPPPDATTPTPFPTVPPGDDMPLGTGHVLREGNIRSEPRVADETMIGEVCPGDEVAFLRFEIVDDVLWYYVRVIAHAEACDLSQVPIGTEGWISGVLVSAPMQPVPAPAEPAPPVEPIPSPTTDPVDEPTEPEPNPEPPIEPTPAPPVDTPDEPTEPPSAHVPPAQPAATATPQPTLVGLVARGSHLYDEPFNTAAIVDQVETGETVQLFHSLPDRSWYYVRSPRSVMGWINALVLEIDPSVAEQVPV